MLYTIQQGEDMRQLTFAVVAMLSHAAYAAPVVWTIEDAAINGGFTYDAATNTYSDVYISSVFYEFISYSDSYLPPFVLENGLLDGNTSTSLGAYTIYDFYGNFLLQLNFATALTNAGGEVSLLPTSSEAEYGAFGGPYEYFFTSGTVSAVPVPAAVWLFGSALAGLGWIRRKQAV